MPKRKSEPDPLDKLFNEQSGFDDLDTLFKGDDDIDVDMEPPDPNDPLKDVKYVGNFEKDAKVELNAMQQAFKDRAKKEKERVELATDSEYWLCACFLDREQKNAFLVALGLEADEKYIDGRIIAKKLGIEIPADPQFSTPRVDETWWKELA